MDKNKIKLALMSPISLFFSIIKRKPTVCSKLETVKAIQNKSIARYGDGELYLMLGMGIKFQEKNKELKKRLIEVARSNNENCIVAIPPIFAMKETGELKPNSVKWWNKNLLLTRGHWYHFFGNKHFYNSFISRFYLSANDKSDETMHNYIEALKSLWNGRDVVMVEGNKTRLGMGNDLFAGAKSIRRILCPSENSFSKYNEIYDAVLKNTAKTDLIICALGPTASVLAYDLSNDRQTLDLGHIDIEYEWFRKKATEKINIEGKYVAESGKDFVENKDFVISNVICEIK